MSIINYRDKCISRGEVFEKNYLINKKMFYSELSYYAKYINYPPDF